MPAPPVTMQKDEVTKSADYYEKGSAQPTKVTSATLRKLEQRRKLTVNNQRLVIVLVGLPGRGKSFIARKLNTYLNWKGVPCKVFNVGKYRREAAAEASHKPAPPEGDDGGACHANFFDSKNEKAKRIREEVAMIALHDMLDWLDSFDDFHKNLKRSDSCCSNASGASSLSMQGATDRIAIFDATNSTQERREKILHECISYEKRGDKATGVVFIESICDDPELLEENFRFKVTNSPDFEGMPEEEAIADLKERVRKYEEQYETLEDDTLSYIKVFNLSSKLLANQIYGRMAKAVVPALMSWNIGHRPIFLVRPGQTEDVIPFVETSTDPSATSPSRPNLSKAKGRLGRLDSVGRRFRDDLREFIHDEGTAFMNDRGAFEPSLHNTGTSMRGGRENIMEAYDYGDAGGFPCKVMSSTMPRSTETVYWEHLPYPVDVLSNLNPLDKGDFTDLELHDMKELHPLWFSQLERDPYNTRFPGGECYHDLVNRLESVVIDLEQQVIPVLVVSHVSVLQVLLAYFRGTPVEQCTSIDVPMHTVIKLTPAGGGGWVERRFALNTEPTSGCNSPTPAEKFILPIWGDSSVTI